MKKSTVLLSTLFFLCACILSRTVGSFIDIPISEVKIALFYLCILAIYMLVKTMLKKNKSKT